MEIRNNNFSAAVVSRTVAFAMAVVTTAFIATGTAVLFAGTAGGFGSNLAAAAAAPLRSVIGF
jgi:hypothetical protein